MTILVHAMLPEIILVVVAAGLFLLGISTKSFARRAAPIIAILALVAAGLTQLHFFGGGSVATTLGDRWQTVKIVEFTRYIKIITSIVGILLVLLAWPADERGVGNQSIEYGSEAAEFFGLMLLSIAGVFMAASANDIMLLFLGIELASIPTYIMVSISRPLAVAQEAGVKYFFLGAMSAAIMLFGFSYLYGTTGTTKLSEMQSILTTGLNPWQVLAVVMLISGFSFKMAAVPMHVYAADVYQSAATPVTAFLSYIPKATGFVALIKILFAVSGGQWAFPHNHEIVKLLAILAGLTMTVGNVLGLLQHNVKRVLAYSSIAHSGYMMVGVTALVATTDPITQNAALVGVLFYLFTYALMNIAAFGVLILLPGRTHQPATSAETYEDIAGLGRKHVDLGLAMAVACFSLIGFPLTVGFFGKYYLLRPALEAGLVALAIILLVNAIIAAGYYLKIVATLFARSEPPAYPNAVPTPSRIMHPMPVVISVGIAMIAVLFLGIVPPATQLLLHRAGTAADLNTSTPTMPVALAH